MSIEERFKKWNKTYKGNLDTEFYYDEDGSWRLIIQGYFSWFTFRAFCVFSEETTSIFFTILNIDNEVLISKEYPYNRHEFKLFKGNCHKIISEIYHQ